jgi:hypothetical protein
MLVRSAIALCLAALGACGGFRVVPADGGALDGSPGDGSRFAVMAGDPLGQTFTGIWGADADNLFVVGTNGVHDDYFSGSWHRQQTVTGRDYHAVWGSAPNEVYAVGVIEGDGRGVVQHYDGNQWRDEFVADTALYGVWGAGQMVNAVGAGGLVYGKVSGTTAWALRISMGLPPNPNVDSSPGAPILWSISGNGPNDFAMAAGLDRVFHYEGSGNFVNLDPIVDRTIDFRTVWAAPSSSTSVFFGGNYFGVYWLTTDLAPANSLLVADGVFRLSADQSLSNAGALFIRGIWGTAAKTIFVGDLGRIYTFDGGTNNLASESSPVTDSLYGVWGASTNNVWIVGERELILHGTLD